MLLFVIPPKTYIDLSMNAAPWEDLYEGLIPYVWSSFQVFELYAYSNKAFVYPAGSACGEEPCY